MYFKYLNIIGKDRQILIDIGHYRTISSSKHPELINNDEDDASAFSLNFVKLLLKWPKTNVCGA